MDNSKDSTSKTSKTVKNVSLNTRSDGMGSERPPDGAKVMDRNVSIRTEEIENGFLVIKDVSGKWYKKPDKTDYHYFNYTEKFYSKNDPLEVTFKDKSLADMFSDSDADD